jgi:chemotaxis signal transduction protein
MPDDLSQASISHSEPMLTPVEALSRGFEFDNQGTGRAAVAITTVTEKAAGGLQLREGFRIGDLGLMIRYEDGSELLDLPPVFTLPNAPDWFPGIANLHGTLVPVFDLARYFGVEHTAQAKPMLLVLGHGVDAAGVVIDGLPLRLRFDSSERAEDAPIPSTLENCVSQTYWAGERTWMDLQVNALMNKLNDELAAANK